MNTKNLLMYDLSHEFYVDIATELVRFGFNISVLGAAEGQEYQPKGLDRLIEATKAKKLVWDDFNKIERFNKIFDPDFSIISPDSLQEISYYERMFMLATDRYSFDPISQIDRYRLYYRFIAHFYKILKSNEITGVVLFGPPHGLAAITMVALAKLIKIKIIYLFGSGISMQHSTVESEITSQRSYTLVDMELRKNVGISNQIASHNYENFIHSGRAFYDEDNNPSQSIANKTKIGIRKSRAMVFVRQFIGLLVKKPFSEYDNPGVFLNKGNRLRYKFLAKLPSYFISQTLGFSFYEKASIEKIEDKKFIAYFLNMQPEATTVPMAGIYADHLLALDLILQAAPDDMLIYIKEHPFMYSQFGQDRHDRSVEFYRYALKDSRVKFISSTVSSKELIDKAEYIISVNGTVCWESLLMGKPSIVFSWTWYSDCESCYFVDSVNTLSDAFIMADRKSREEVMLDVKTFLRKYGRRLIDTPGDRSALEGVDKNFSYQQSILSAAKAIQISYEQAAQKE